MPGETMAVRKHTHKHTIHAHKHTSTNNKTHACTLTSTHMHTHKFYFRRCQTASAPTCHDGVKAAGPAVLLPGEVERRNLKANLARGGLDVSAALLGKIRELAAARPASRL